MGGWRAQTHPWKDPTRDEVVSAPALRDWGLRSRGAGGDRALPGVGKGVLKGSGAARGRGREGIGPFQGWVCEGIGSCPG